MSIERELLKKVITGDDDGKWIINHILYNNIKELLAHPQQELDEETTTWEDAVEMFRDGYRAGYKNAEQKLKREPLHIDRNLFPNDSSKYTDGFIDGVLYAEKQHGIGDRDA